MERCIYIDGEKISVTEEVCQAYIRPVWRERKRRKVRNKKERSLDAFADVGFDIPSDGALVDDVIAGCCWKCLWIRWTILSPRIVSVIDALYYQERTMRNIASDLGLSRVSVHKRKNKILDKLRQIIKL